MLVYPVLAAAGRLPGVGIREMNCSPVHLVRRTLSKVRLLIVDGKIIVTEPDVLEQQSRAGDEHLISKVHLADPRLEPFSATVISVGLEFHTYPISSRSRVDAASDIGIELEEMVISQDRRASLNARSDDELVG